MLERKPLHRDHDGRPKAAEGCQREPRSPSTFWHEVGVDESMELGKEMLVEVAIFKIPSLDPGFNAQDPLCQKRS